MKPFAYIYLATSLLFLPQLASAELWQCKSEVEGRVVFTNQPLGDCKKHLPKAGSFSSVPQTYFDLLVEEHKDYFRQSPLGQLTLQKEPKPKLEKGKRKAKERKQKKERKLTKGKKLSQKASDKLWR